MSVGHMPRWFQTGFIALWLASAATAVGLFLTHPFETAFSPFPAIVTGVLVLSIAHAAWRAVTGDPGGRTVEQARLTDYAGGEDDG